MDKQELLLFGEEILPRIVKTAIQSVPMSKAQITAVIGSIRTHYRDLGGSGLLAYCRAKKARASSAGLRAEEQFWAEVLRIYHRCPTKTYILDRLVEEICAHMAYISNLN